MSISIILRRQADYARNSGIVVDIDRAYQTVSLHDNIFMQGDDAQDFIDAVDALANRCPSLPFDICELAAAYDYCELLED